MQYLHSEQAAYHPFSIKHHIFFSLMLVAATILPATNINGATITSGDGNCAFSLQLQSSPYREEFTARLAMALGTMLASRTDTDSSVQSDAPSFISMILGSSRFKRMDVETVDAFSAECLGCHNGTTAHDINFNFRNSPSNTRQQKYDGGRDHPNGMDYQSYVVFGRGKFNPVATLNSNMKFVDGKVGCLTCHNPLNPEKGHLVMKDFKSALCLTCHNL